MGKKIRLIRTMIIEFEPNTEYYPEGLSIEQIAELETNRDDRELVFDECLSDEVKWEIIEEE